jgi:hypothetical protein
MPIATGRKQGRRQRRALPADKGRKESQGPETHAWTFSGECLCPDHVSADLLGLRVARNERRAELAVMQHLDGIAELEQAPQVPRK